MLARRVCLVVFCALIAALLAAPAGAAEVGEWEVYVTADYRSHGTETDAHCVDADGNRITLDGTASRHVTVQTIKPATLVMYETPNGTGVVAESGASHFRGKITETRSSTLDAAGKPAGCEGGRTPDTHCRPVSLAGPAYFNPLGPIHGWKGFSFEPTMLPRVAETCGLTAAQQKVPDAGLVEVEARPSELTSNRKQVVFRGRDLLSGTGREDGVASVATGVLNYTVKLVRAH